MLIHALIGQTKYAFSSFPCYGGQTLSQQELSTEKDLQLWEMEVQGTKAKLKATWDVKINIKKQTRILSGNTY